MIARNHLNQCIGGIAKPALCGSSFIAECEAVLEGVTLARDLHIKKLILSTDSLEFVTNIRNPLVRGSWRIFPIMNKIRKIAVTFDEIQWEWSLREANRVAHAAASLASRAVDLQRWASVPPPSLSLVLRNDGLPCPHMGVL